MANYKSAHKAMIEAEKKLSTVNAKRAGLKERLQGLEEALEEAKADKRGALKISRKGR